MRLDPSPLPVRRLHAKRRHALLPFRRRSIIPPGTGGEPCRPRSPVGTSMPPDGVPLRPAPSTGQRLGPPEGFDGLPACPQVSRLHACPWSRSHADTETRGRPCERRTAGNPLPPTGLASQAIPRPAPEKRALIPPLLDGILGSAPGSLPSKVGGLLGLVPCSPEVSDRAAPAPLPQLTPARGSSSLTAGPDEKVFRRPCSGVGHAAATTSGPPGALDPLDGRCAPCPPHWP